MGSEMCIRDSPNYVDGLRLALSNEREGVSSNRLVVVLNPAIKGEPVVANWKLRPVIYWFNVYNELPVDLNLEAKYLFASTDESVVTVDEEGRLTYHEVGTAKIMVYEKNTELKTLLDVEVLPYDTNYFKKDSSGNPTDELAYRLTAPALATGVDFSVALTANGFAYAWGSNQQGQAGQNQMRDKYYDSFIPVQSGSGEMGNILSVAAGNNFALAAHKDGYVYAWGQNASGSLGLNTDLSNTGSYPTPQWVKGPDGTGYLGDDRTGKIIKVFAYGNSAAALTERGELYVWGESGSYQLGARDDASYYLYPQKVPGLNHVQDVYISGKNMIIVTEGTEIWVAGAQGTRIVGWGDSYTDYDYLDREGRVVSNYSYYPLPMINNKEGKERNYQDAAASVSLGASQAVFMTLEYKDYSIKCPACGAEYAKSDDHVFITRNADDVITSITLNCACGQVTDIDMDKADSDELLEKHLYLLGQDVNGVLGTLLKTEETETEDTTGITNAYVNTPTEYSYFDDTELNRLKELMDDAYLNLSKYGLSLIHI